MERREELEALLARVEAADGPDRKLDAEIWNALRPEATILAGGRCRVAYQETDARKLDRFHDGWFIRFDENDKYPSDLPQLSGSLDACQTLQERVLPGWVGGRSNARGYHESYLMQGSPLRQSPIMARGKSEPLAWLASIIRARLSTEEG